MEGIEILDKIITGRVTPHIYAFETSSVPSYLKVGDTYRPVHIRLKEWAEHYGGIKQRFEQVAKVSKDTYFRDYAVHQFLTSKGFHRAEKTEFGHGVYYSNEFFKGVEDKDLKDAITDIQQSFDQRDNRYSFYNAEDRLPIAGLIYKRTEDWKPRKNQQEVIDNFMRARANGRTNLLMYAVMRFGKTFTALCCAKEMDAHLVVVVSGKTAVSEEWKENVERPLLFEGYFFLSTNDLKKHPNAVTTYLKEGKKVVLFLTLQDLLGDDVKERHKDLFTYNEQGDIDLLIIDESHFAARSEETGKVLRSFNKRDIERERKGYDESLEDLNEPVKLFKPKMKLHLSGTPYRILLDGEFKKEDNIASVQYSDIVKAQAAWDKENMTEDEWKNPYYGFPEMVRFAFNLNKSSKARLEELREEGIDYRLNALFRPVSLYKDGKGNHRKFKYAKEVLDLLLAIDGKSQDENIFSFLDYKRIKEGDMCRHLVMVLPFRASCDAMEKLLRSHSFCNLSSYEIINISGFDSPKKYDSANEHYVENIKHDIEACELNDKKTITLTVGKMLTGSTVKYWDTMIYLKNVSSPQEYEQAIYRLQSQYTKTIKNASGDSIIYNMKPQTLLVDFDPTRMFVMQNRKSLIANINSSLRGNEELGKCLDEELSISPIIWLYKDKLQRVTPNNIFEAVREYSKNKSIMDETFDIVVDDGVFNDSLLRTFIEAQPEMSAAGNVFKADPHKAEGEGDDIDTPPTDNQPKEENRPENKNSSADEQKSLRKKLQTYYFKILLFAYISDLEEKTLLDVITNIENSEDGKRIANHLQLDVEGLKLIRERIHPTALNELENKISNIDTLSGDSEANVLTALRRFSRLSSSELTTPLNVTNMMIQGLPDYITESSRILNFAGKTGEFEYTLCKLYGEDIKKHIYCLPTSGVTYECTRKMFTLLGIPVENVFEEFTTFDLIQTNKKQKLLNRLSSMKFDAIIGNPPYQEKDGGAGVSSKPLYNEFITALFQLNSPCYSVILPSRWMVGGKGLDDFRSLMLNDRHMRELHDFLHPEELFPNTNNRGGVCYFLRDKSYDNHKDLVKVTTHDENNQTYTINRHLKTVGQNIFIRNSRAFSILEKVEKHTETGKYLADFISPRKPFGIEGNIVNNMALFHQDPSILKRPIKCYGKGGKVGFIEEADISTHKEWINTWKVLFPYANNIGTELNDDNQNTFVAPPNSVCTETFLIAGAELKLNKQTAQNLADYMRTKFARFMLSLAKNSQHGTSKTYRFVPIQDFSRKWTDEDLFQKYELTAEEIEIIESAIKPMA